jgi:hypothetical protein
MYNGATEVAVPGGGADGSASQQRAVVRCQSGVTYPPAQRLGVTTDARPETVPSP